MPKTRWEDAKEEWKEKSVTTVFLTCERQDLECSAMQKPQWRSDNPLSRSY